MTSVVGDTIATLTESLRPERPPNLANFPRLRVAVVCHGNVCRSPLAKAILDRVLWQEGLALLVSVASGATSACNVGRHAFWRTRICAVRHHLNLRKHRARQLTPAELAACNYILAVDRKTLVELQSVMPRISSTQPTLLLDFVKDPCCKDVPDPINGDSEEFERAFFLLERGCTAVVADIKRRLQSAE